MPIRSNPYLPGEQPVLPPVAPPSPEVEETEDV